MQVLPKPTDESLVSWYTAGLLIVWPPIRTLTKQDWRGGHQLGVQGDGVILAINHISWIDPFAVAHYVNDHGRSVRFLAKAEVFDVPLGGRILKGTNQIPVHREGGQAADAVSAAVEAVKTGGCVIVYPEGTITRDPELWPMTGKTGVARIALESRRPVVPVAQWGAHEIMPPYQTQLNLFPRKTIRIWAGDPVDLSDLYRRKTTEAVLQVATNRIMDAVTEQLSLIRGEPAPADRWDRKAEARVPRGPTTLPRARRAAKQASPAKPQES